MIRWIGKYKVMYSVYLFMYIYTKNWTYIKKYINYVQRIKFFFTGNFFFSLCNVIMHKYALVCMKWKKVE